MSDITPLAQAIPEMRFVAQMEPAWGAPCGMATIKGRVLICTVLGYVIEVRHDELRDDYRLVIAVGPGQ